jgi:hypothetical protein
MHSPVIKAISRGGGIPLITSMSPTMRMHDRWNLQGKCKSNCRHIIDHGFHQPLEMAALVSWCQVAYDQRLSNHIPPSTGMQLIPPADAANKNTKSPQLQTHPDPANSFSSITPVASPGLSVEPISIQNVSSHERVSDELGDLIDVAVTKFNQSPSWDEFVAKSRHT